MTNIPSALEEFDTIAQQLQATDLAVFLDYDGTLTPIVERPEAAVLSPAMQQTVAALSTATVVAVISGRDLHDVKTRVSVPSAAYSGSHGFEVEGPNGSSLDPDKGDSFLPALAEAENQLREHLGNIEGLQFERKKYSLAIHVRNVSARDTSRVEREVQNYIADQDALRVSKGKKVLDLQPNIDWDKGHAVLWLLDQLKLNRPRVVPLYIGDDVTDEDAFRALSNANHKNREGITIFVGEDVDLEQRSTLAKYRLNNPDEVQQFLARLLQTLT